MFAIKVIQKEEPVNEVLVRIARAKYGNYGLDASDIMIDREERPCCVKAPTRPRGIFASRRRPGENSEPFRGKNSDLFTSDRRQGAKTRLAGSAAFHGGAVSDAFPLLLDDQVFAVIPVKASNP